jgi:arsenite-transporting ATPase
VFETAVGTAPTPIPGAPRLRAARVDAARAFACWLEPRRAILAAIGIRGTYLDDEDVARLLNLSLPGIDETVGLLEIVRLAREDAGFARVIVDTAPTGHTLRLLSAPELLRRAAGVLDTMQSHHRAVVAALRGSYRADASDGLIEELDRDGRSLAALLRDSASTRISWVTLPEPMALEETSDAIAALERDGIRVSRLIVNRTIAWRPVARKVRASEDGCAWCEARRRFEARALAPVAGRLGGRELFTLPDLGGEPRGVRALRKAARRLTPYSAPPALPAVERRIRAWTKMGDSPLLVQEKGTTALLDGRWLLFGGKGGVGKSTCAAAAALAASQNRRVLLISSDPAHSLGDVFGAAIDDEAGTIPGAPASLHVREIDASAEFGRFRQRYVEAVDDAFGRLARAAEVEQSAFRELIDLAPPGIDEVIAIAEISSALIAEGCTYDLVVTDTAPTGHALHLLRTPGILREWTQALMTILRKYRTIVPAGGLAELLVQLSKRVRGLQEILSDASRTRVVVVTRAATLPVAESEDLIRALDALHISVGAVIVNAIGAGDCGRCSRTARSQAAELERLRHALRGRRYAIIGAPAEIPPPHGAAALADWGAAWRQIA